MVPDTASASATRGDCEVMAAVDSEQFIIADLCRDDAWLSMSLSDSATLHEWQ